MSDEQWIVIPNWDKFQHYKDRNPTWIKLYTELDSDPNWDKLTLPQRGLLVTIWIMYARSRGKVNLKACAKRVGRSYKAHSVKSLSDAGFIVLSASTDKDSTSYCLDKEADSRASALPIKQSQTGGNHIPSDSLAERLLTEIRDANNRTRRVLHEFEQRLPDAAFATALESLQQRRRRTDRGPLTSEARYVVATLTQMEREGQYAR
jgi:hypothetical protein